MYKIIMTWEFFPFDIIFNKINEKRLNSIWFWIWKDHCAFALVTFTHHPHSSKRINRKINKVKKQISEDKLKFAKLKGLIEESLKRPFCHSVALHNVLFVQYVFLTTKQSETYFKIFILTYDLTYICPFFFIFVYFKL